MNEAMILGTVPAEAVAGQPGAQRAWAWGFSEESGKGGPVLSPTPCKASFDPACCG